MIDLTSHLTTDDFNYELPESLIAQQPLDERALSRMMVISRESKSFDDEQFLSFLEYVNPNDCLVFNDTRVFPARLFGHKSTGGKVECLIERITGERQALAHLKASKAPKADTVILFEGEHEAVVVARKGDLFELDFKIDSTLLDMLNKSGHLPLPPYITRPPAKKDAERYQTVFSKEVGAVAAPTAGLHFDEAMLSRIREKGVSMASITLHVGAGTFQPVRVDSVADHTMHSEWIEVSEGACKKIAACQQRKGRVIAVGTTVLRALESASLGGQLRPYSGETDIFIYPGFEFRCVNALLTNFHLPRSTLLMLVSALVGREFMLSAYQHAVRRQYRFFSYGDCMLIL